MRMFLTIVLPLVLPTLLYVLWLVAIRGGKVAGPAGWMALPWPWLLLAGLALTSVLLVFISVHMGNSERGLYVPPQYIDGRVVPGHVVPADPARR